MSAPPDQLVDDVLARHGARLAEAVRRHQHALHAIPELAFEEHETARYVAERLEELGLAPRRGVAGTGLLVELPGAGPGPTILLRADMDGLPLDEHPAHEPRSRHAGRMHACGHDGHMAIALGVAEAACRASPRLPGRLLLLFQPAEETGNGGPSGAERIVRDGLLDDEGVDAVLGLHLWSFLPLGRAIVPPRTVLASSDELRVTLRGPGGHAALPHLARDVILAGSELVVALQAIVARDVDPVRPAVVSIGRFESGSAANVLPAEARLWGTVRAPDAATRGELRGRIEAVAASVAAARGVEAAVAFDSGYPATVNDPHVAAVLRDAARVVLGDGAVADGPPTMAAEDFAFYLERRPGAFMLLGMRDEAAGAVHAHHSPRFRIAQPALDSGVAILLRAAAALLASGVPPGR